MRVQASRDQINVTRNGMLGGPADALPRFIHGPWRYELMDDDGGVVEITPEEYEHFRGLLAERIAEGQRITRATPSP